MCSPIRPLLVLVACAWLAGGALAGAQEPGALTGLVRTIDGTPLPQVVILVQGPEGSRSAVTGPGGRYRAEGLRPGAHALAAQAPGFLLSPDRWYVPSGETRLDLTLAPAPIREHVVVAATRGDAALSTLGVSATVLDARTIAEREPSDLLGLLQQVPGVAVARAGGFGLAGSAFVRGGESRFALILVDGVPVNEPGGFHNFGGQIPLELGSVEVVRGAASSLYGTDALAGVVQILTRRAGADERPGVAAEAEVGDFSWRRVQGTTSGRSGRLDWTLGLQRLETDNQQPNSAFTQNAGAASLGAGLGARSDLRLVVRADTSRTGTPGQTAFGRPDLDASYERDAFIAGVQLRHLRERATHELRAGFSQSGQLSLNPEDSGSFVPEFEEHLGSYPVSDFPNPEGFQNDTRRLSFGYRAEVQVSGSHLLTLGGEADREAGEMGDRREDPLRPERTNLGVYLQDRVVLVDRVFVTVGARLEHNHSYGTTLVPRAALAWRVRGGADATTLRASGGEGVKEPSFLESFGVSTFARGNPDLKPERSRTYDLGVEQRLFGSRLRAEVVLFHHSYRDQIAYAITDYTTFEGSYVNLGETRARGLELSLAVAPVEGLRLDASYTLLDGEILTSTGSFDPVLAEGRSLLRRPRHQGSASAHLRGGRIDGGMTVQLVGRRGDSDFLGLGLTENQGYTRLDARLRVRLTHGLEAFAAGENLADRTYQEVLGYPALGRSLRLGLRYLGGRGCGD